MLSELISVPAQRALGNMQRAVDLSNSPDGHKYKYRAGLCVDSDDFFRLPDGTEDAKDLCEEPGNEFEAIEQGELRRFPVMIYEQIRKDVNGMQTKLGVKGELTATPICTNHGGSTTQVGARDTS